MDWQFFSLPLQESTGAVQPGSMRQSHLSLCRHLRQVMGLRCHQLFGWPFHPNRAVQLQQQQQCCPMHGQCCLQLRCACGEMATQEIWAHLTCPVVVPCCTQAALSSADCCLCRYLMSKLRGPRYHLVFVQPNAPQLEAIGKLMAQGKLTIPIERELPLERARQGCLAYVGSQQDAVQV